MKKEFEHSLAFLSALFVILIWGETFVSSKILLGAGLKPSDIFFYRFILAYVFIWIVSPKKLWAQSLRDELTLVVTGLMGGSLYFLAENSALQFSTASNVAILVSSSPLVTACLLSIFYKDERMGRKQIAGSLLAFTGMVLVILNGQLILKINPLGDMLALGAALTWGFYSLSIKSIAHKYDSIFITRKVFAYGLVTIIPWCIFINPLETSPDILLSSPAIWGNLLYLGLVASMLCYILWNWSLAKLGTVRATNMLYFQPFFTMLAGFIFLHEKITWMAIAGTAILIFGMTNAIKK